MSAPGRRWLRHAVVDRWAGLDFVVELPEDWRLDTGAGPTPDFGAEPAALVNLATAHAPGGVVWSVSARPATTSTPLAWSVVYLLREHGIEPGDDDDRALGTLPAIGGRGWRNGAGGTREELRYTMAEDGGRLVQVCVAGPPESAGRIDAAWPRLLSSFRLLAPRQPTPAPQAHSAAAAGPSAWWLQAQQLERDGRIDDALSLIDRACDHAGGVLARAELLARRMRRLAEAGDVAAARDVHRRAAMLAWSYAAGATSGGEGAALSIERDRFLRELGPAP